MSIKSNFMGLSDKQAAWQNSRAVILPVSYDLTTCYMAGTRRGPQAIIDASTQLELFDDELLAEISEVGIHTAEFIEPDTRGPEFMISRVEQSVGGVIEAEKMPVMLGGEHSISLGAVRAFSNSGVDFGVLQFDAHADLRDEYLGTPYNHACVARRIHELCPVTQVGVRSLCTEEHLFLSSHKSIAVFPARDIHSRSSDRLKECIGSLPERIYITIDLDVLDTAVMPAVGTPEPGGMGWYELTGILRQVSLNKKVVGFDLVELRPLPDNPAPDFLAAKLCYKLIGYTLMHNT